MTSSTNTSWQDGHKGSYVRERKTGVMESWIEDPTLQYSSTPAFQVPPLVPVLVHSADLSIVSDRRTSTRAFQAPDPQRFLRVGHWQPDSALDRQGRAPVREVRLEREPGRDRGGKYRDRRAHGRR